MEEARPFAAGNASSVESPETALEDIVRRYSRLIRHAIRKAGGAEASGNADDIEQTVFVNLWRQLAREQTIDHPASYLYKAAIRETVRAVRRERDRAEAAASAAPDNAPEPVDPESMTVARQRRQALASAIAGLTP